MKNQNVINLVKDLSACPEVEAILLAGSMTTNSTDQYSDYDLYIYINAMFAVDKRKKITDKYFKYIELNNTFWEMEDDGILNDDIPVELIYRDANWLADELKRTVIQCEANIGYSTCFWHNLLTSCILFDRSNRLTAMKEKFNVAYPLKLQENIVNKNYPLLKEKIPAYYNQIKKALSRHDLISVNHRVAAFLESYFDILFALNKKTHPGEKKLIKIASKLEMLPNDFSLNIEKLLTSMTTADATLLSVIDLIINELEKILNKQP